MEPNLIICDLDESSTIIAKTICALANAPARMTTQTWRKLIDVWACSYGYNMAHINDDGRFVEQVSQGRIEQNAAEMRQRQAIPYNGEWYEVTLID